MRNEFDLGEGIVHYVAKDEILASRGMELRESRDGGSSWTTICHLPIGLYKSWATPYRIARRYLRALVYHARPVDHEHLVVVGGSKIFTISRDGGDIVASQPIIGSHPLTLCATDNAL